MSRPAFIAIAIATALLALGHLHPAVAQTQLPDGFEDRLVAGGLDFPVGMAWLSAGRLLVTEQNSARVRLITTGASPAVYEVGVVDDVISGGERGLLGIAVDPGFPTRPYVYVICDQSGSRMRIARYTLTGDLAASGNGVVAFAASSRYDLVNDIPDNASNHNGGTLRFGVDGMLYASLGDDADQCGAQNTSLLKGVILRLDVSRLPGGPGGPAPRALIAASGNPFVASPDSNARLVWAYGLRNPFRFHIDGVDGALFIADVGLTQREEMSRVSGGGANLGWPELEGTYFRGSACPPAAPVAPIYEYDRTGFTAAIVSAGPYRGGSGDDRFPAAYEGDVFLSDYYAGFLRRLEGSGSSWNIAPAVAGQPGGNDWGRGFDAVSDYLVGADGALWYCRQAIAFASNSGQIRRIVYASESPPPDTTTAAFALAPPFPLPAPGYVNLRYTLGAPARVEIVIYDFRGARVRMVEPAAQQPAGIHDRTWDGRDDRGRAVDPGIYFVHVAAGEATVTRRIPLIR